MDWMSVLSAAIAGALAAAIASLLFLRKSKDHRFAYTTLTVVLFLGFKLFSDQSILPRIREWQTDEQLRELPFYRDLAEVDPLTYEKVRVVMSDSVRKGDGADVIASRIAPIVAGTVPKYVGTASDDSVVAFIDVVIRQVESLHSSHSDACYYFLFPHEQGATPGLISSWDQKNRDESIVALGRIVHSAVHTPQPLPDARKAETLLVPVMDQLRNEFGNDLLLLQQKPTDTVGRQKVCAITVFLYRNVEALSQRDASLLLRYLLSDSNKSTPEK
jgi:hypothetical protein